MFLGGSALHVLIAVQVAVLLIVHVPGADGSAVHLLLLFRFAVFGGEVVVRGGAGFNSIHN